MNIEKNEVGEIWEIIKIWGIYLDPSQYIFKMKTLQSILQKRFLVKYIKIGLYTFSRPNKTQNNLY